MRVRVGCCKARERGEGTTIAPGSGQIVSGLCQSEVKIELNLSVFFLDT
jgi:hypothetical protein